MRSPLALVLALVGLVAIPLGCDWPPGSTASWSQTVRTWVPLSSGQCLTLGSYAFAVGADWPEFDVKASLKMKTANKDDQEFLPPYFQINYRLNGTPIYQQEFDLKNGKGSSNQSHPDGWTFNVNDEISYEICQSGGYIPFGTQISASFNYKFAKLDFK